MSKGRSKLKKGRLQLIPHPHSLKLRPHRHTSYASLAFMLVLTGIVLVAFSGSTSAAAPAANPVSGSVGLTGKIAGKAPGQAATITSPLSGGSYTAIPITVSGTCPADSFVLITKNNAFAGAVDCTANDTYSLKVDLFDGANVLIAKVSDALGQFGPDSAPVNVFYNAPSLSVAGGAAVGQQLFLQADTTIAAVTLQQALNRTATIVGGVGPYAVSFDWGDGSNSLQTVVSAGTISANHSYTRSGNYRVIVKVTDTAGNTAFLQLVSVVDGPLSATGTTDSKTDIPGLVYGIWPLYVGAVMLVGVFWLGEIRGVSRLRRRLQRV